MLAVISDIHSNVEALTAVLADIDAAVESFRATEKSLTLLQALAATQAASRDAIAAPRRRSLTGLAMTLRTPRSEVKPGVWIQAVLASGTFTFVTIFLAWHGVIGIRTWS